MPDFVVFLQDVKEEGTVVFHKGKEYEVLDENNKEYFIQRVKNTNEVSAFPKELLNTMFKFGREYQHNG